METFRIGVTPTEGTCTLSLAGEADLAVADDIVALGTAGLEDATVHTLVIDMTDVTFLDSTVLSALVKLSLLAEDRAKSLALAHVPNRVQRVLKIAGLDSVFAIV